MKKLIVVLCLGLVVTSCKMDKEQSGSLPSVDIDIDADSGELPEYDIDWVDINVGTRTKMVEVPKVVVVMEEEEIEVPYLDFDMPGEDKMEKSIMVEAEITGKEHNIEIKEIRASKKRLYVISTIEELDTELDGKTMRIQDQVEINAPDLDVKHIIVGKKGKRSFNNNYMYVNTMNDLDDIIKNAKVIYKK